MSRLAGRPRGILLIAIVLALNGVASLLDAAGFIDRASRTSFTGNLIGVFAPAAVASLVVAILLLRRAYGLWRLRRRVWLTTLLLLVGKLATGSVQLLFDVHSLVALVLVLIPFLAVVYLTNPAVRGQFADDRTTWWYPYASRVLKHFFPEWDREDNGRPPDNPD